MKQLIILLIIGLSAGMSAFFGTARNGFAAGDALYHPAAPQSREAGIAGTGAAQSGASAGSAGYRASFDLSAWHLEDQGRPLYDNNSFRFSTFRFQHEQENIKASVGDLSVRSSELIAPSLSRRGALLGFQKTGYSAEAFSMRSSPVKDLQSGLGLSDDSQILIGGRVTHTLDEDRGMRLTFHYLDGRREDPIASAVDPETAHQEGSAYSTALESSIVGGMLKFYGEYCYSRFDEDTEDTAGAAADRAWNVKLFGSVKRFSYALEYKRLGEEFQTIANPCALNNRDVLSADTEYRMGSSSVALSVLQTRSNVGNAELAPLTVYRTAKIGYRLSLSGWPTLFVNQSLSTRRTTGETDGYEAVDTVSRTTYFGISYTKGVINLTPSYSFTRFTDKTAPSDGSDSLTHTARLVCGIRPDRWLSLKPVFIYRNHLVEESDVRITTYQGSLVSTVQIIPQTLTIDTTVSYLEKNADDRNTGVTEKKAGYQLSWNIGKYLREMGHKSLAFMGEFIQTEDRAEELSTRKYTLSLVASIGLPFDQLEYQSQCSRFPRDLAVR